jgi:hypothetical protein
MSCISVVIFAPFLLQLSKSSRKARADIGDSPVKFMRFFLLRKRRGGLRRFSLRGELEPRKLPDHAHDNRQAARVAFAQRGIVIGIAGIALDLGDLPFDDGETPRNHVLAAL